MELIPLDAAARQTLQLPFLALTDDGRELPSSSITAAGLILSAGWQLCYLEAEYFGGQGAQASVRFANGEQVGQPLINGEAINQALRWLGIVRTQDQDEFDVVGPGAHRDTDHWR